jgi:hypothetical protein
MILRIFIFGHRKIAYIPPIAIQSILKNLSKGAYYFSVGNKISVMGCQKFAKK